MVASTDMEPVRKPTVPDLELSVVVPVYRAADCLRELHQRLVAVLDPLVGVDGWELVLVDDRSPDDSWSVVTAIASDDARVNPMRLSRNFGQEAATSAGLEAARGRWIVTMDCDLQDRPEDIPSLLDTARSGFQNVRARRNKTGSWHRVAGTRFYFAVLNRMAGTRVDWQYAAFGVISHTVRDAYLAIPDNHRNLLLVLDWLGYDSTHVDVAHDPRFAGESAYSLRLLIRYAASGVFFQTTAPLRWIVYLGLLESILGLMGSVYLVGRRLSGATLLPGWTSLMIVVLLIGGVTVVSIGIASLYIGSIFDQVRARPRFIVDDSANHAVSPESSH